MLCIAHRGGPLAGQLALPENSLAAIQRALDIGVKAIEIDVFQVGGELWVTHDRRLGRVVSGQGVVTELSPQYLSAQTLDNGEPLPKLRDVLSLIGDKALLNIEIKGTNVVPYLKLELEAFISDFQQSIDQYIVSSFDHHQLFKSMHLIPNLRRGVLIEGLPLDYAACCDPLKAYSFNTHLSFLSPELLADARKRGYKNWVYTVNHADDWLWLQGWGVDGVFTDKPDALLQFLEKKRGK